MLRIICVRSIAMEAMLAKCSMIFSSSFEKALILFSESIVIMPPKRIATKANFNSGDCDDKIFFFDDVTGDGFRQFDINAGLERKGRG